MGSRNGVGLVRRCAFAAPLAVAPLAAGQEAGAPEPIRLVGMVSVDQMSPDQLGPGSSRYRVSYLSGGNRVGDQTGGPTGLPHRLAPAQAAMKQSTACWTS